MKVKDIKSKPKSELQHLLKDRRNELREARFNLASGKVKNVKVIRGLKKDIARILTVLNEKTKQV